MTNADIDATLIFGTNWSVTCWDIRNLLEKHHIPFEYLDVDHDSEASQWLEEQLGEKMLPAVLLPNGTLLVEPSLREVAQNLGF